MTWPEPGGTLAAEVEVLAIRRGAVKLSSRAVRLPGDPGSAAILEALRAAPVREHLSLPGQVL